MSWIDFFKNLFGGSKLALQTPRTAETSVESIEFPNTYKTISICTTMPPRPTQGLSGSEFGKSILNVAAGPQRDELIYQQCIAGNMPNWLKNFKRITVEDANNTLTYFVSPDVLCVGDDADFLRVSLNGYTARKIVDAFGCMLPTKKMSDQIWLNADLRLSPVGMGASPNMTNTQTLIDHNAVVEKQRAGRNFTLIAGIKKDIIFHSKLLTYVKNICIYGWHYTTGVPIQGAQYVAHDIYYQDYSHSIRLVSRKASLNGQDVDLMDVLKNPLYSRLINDENVVYDASSIYK